MNFDRAVQALCDAGVEFIIIGGWSAILHGSAHVTSDLDLLGEVSGLGSFDEVASSSLSVDAFGRKVRTLDLPSLLEAQEPGTPNPRY